MTPAEITAVRKRTGLTQAQFAAALRFGTDGRRTVRRWEAGQAKLRGPVSIIYELLQDGSVRSKAPRSASSCSRTATDRPGVKRDT